MAYHKEPIPIWLFWYVGWGIGALIFTGVTFYFIEGFIQGTMQSLMQTSVISGCIISLGITIYLRRIRHRFYKLEQSTFGKWKIFKEGV